MSDMNTPILHHFEASPFSEKIRIIFGFKRIAWQSVLIPRIMPKPFWCRSPAVIAARLSCRSEPTFLRHADHPARDRDALSGADPGYITAACRG